MEQQTMEMYFSLGYIGHCAEAFKALFSEYSEEPNQYGKFLKFENYSDLVVNQGVMCHTNCFENEEHFREIFNQKLLSKFLEKNLLESK